MTEVVVTGVGAITPLGGTAEATWRELLAGKSGAALIDSSQVEKHDFPVKIAASMAVDPAERLSPVEARKLDRSQQAALVASREACAQAGIRVGFNVDPERIAVIIGSGIGGLSTLLGQIDVLETRGMRRVLPATIPMVISNGPAVTVGLELNARAGVHAPVSACASGAEAVAWAWRMLRAGEADVVVAGGVDACILPPVIAGFARMKAMSTRNDEPERASRPFDLARGGFVLGEGAGVVVMERADFAVERGVEPRARLAGVGTSADAHHVSAPDPTGRGAAAAIRAALRASGVEAEAVDHVNAHATGTTIGDTAEAEAVKLAVGDHPSITAIKGGLGHLLGGCGPVGLISAIRSIEEHVVPPTVNADHVDPGIGLDVVTDKPRYERVCTALVNSFGFGGHNVCLVVVEK